MKFLLISLGFTCIILGAIGIILPILPTTPFLLLAAWCFSKSSERWNNWIRQHRIFGPFIKNYTDKKGILKRHKFVAYITILISFSTSIYISSNPNIIIALTTIGITLTILIFKFKTLED